jgi:MFS family permease
MFRPVLQTLIADHASVDHRGKVMGSFDVSFYAALCVGPVIGGMIMDSGGFQSLFSVLIVCSLAALGLAISTIPRQLTTKFGLVHESNQPGSRFLYWQCGTLKGLLTFIFGRACGITACATFLPILLSSKLGLNGMRVGMVMAAATLAMTVLLRPFGKLADKAPCRLLVICGGTVVPLLYMLLPFVETFSQALAVTLGIGVFSALSQPAVSALLAQEGQRNGMGACIGTFHAYLNLGFVAGPLLGSLVQTATDLHGVFIGIGVVGLCSVLGFAVTTSQTTSLILAKKGKAYLSS